MEQMSTFWKCPPANTWAVLTRNQVPHRLSQAHPPMRQLQEDMGVGQDTAMVKEHESGEDSVAIT